MGISYDVRTMFQTEQPALRKVQVEALKTLRKHKNLLIVSPCGSGKTEAAYLVSKRWSGRTIYALPMKSLASSIQERLDGYERHFPDGEQWTLQHSSQSNDPNLENRYSVTTLDQILSGYYGFGRESFIRGSNVIKSNLILDEVQLAEPDKSLSSLFILLDSLKETGQNFVMMTATFPTSLQKFLQERYDVGIVQIDDNETNKSTLLNWSDELTGKQLEETTEKQLVICNTQAQQVALYHEITDKSRVIVLNSKLLPSERIKREAEVDRYFGKRSEPNNKILLATQIVEAGMDLSANVVYSYEAPIDSLIQREGRCARWGGQGNFTVVAEERHRVYPEELVARTSELVKSHIGKEFDWNTQQEWVSKVLNDYYERVLTPRALRRFQRKLKDGNRSDLVRDIQQVSVIVSDTAEHQDFQRESISVHATSISKGKRLEKGRVVEGRPDIGDTVIIDGKDWVYDVCGFRKAEGEQCVGFPYSLQQASSIEFTDYIEESWVTHANETGKWMEETLKRDGLINKKDIAHWRTVAALHDLGKLTTDWQSFIGGSDQNCYAHRPWEPRSSFRIKNKKHNILSGLALRSVYNRLEQNVLMGHHGRLHIGQGIIDVEATRFVSSLNHQLKQVGFDYILPNSQKSNVLTHADIIHPGDDKYTKFLYLTGVLMKSDRKAIRTIRMAFLF